MTPSPALQAHLAVEEDVLRRLRALTAELEEQARRSDAAIRAELGAIYDLAPAAVYRGGWECPESPTGQCIYDRFEDPFFDGCLVCGEPDDRG